MAVDSNLVALAGAVAGADLSDAVYRFGSLVTTPGSAPYTIVRATAPGAKGVIYSNPPEGTAVTFIVGGVAKVIAGGTIAIGAAVDSDANGAAVATVDSPLIALTAGAAGAVVEVLLSR